MKLRTIVKIAVISSVVLLCTGFAMFSFFRLSAVEGRKDFNLYTLVPRSATVVLETDDLAVMIQSINELSCSKDQHFLYISKLFSYLKLHLYTLLEDTPHGLSKQMNKVLLSFHEPDNDRNQVLYCSLGNGDYELVEKFIRKYCSSSFPSKLFDYKGEEIRIYPMPDDSFLACYFTSDFLAVSYQKKLIEQVIDARLSKKSLLTDSSFVKVHEDKRARVAATIYARMQPLSMGKATDGIRSCTQLGGWTEFDMKMNGDAIYFSGVSHDTDTCMTFMNVLRQQQPVEDFPGDILPASTFFFNKRSVTDMQAMLDFTARQEYTTSTYSDYIRDRDGELLAFLKDNAGGELVTCLFHSADTLANPCAVMTIPLKDVQQAERVLQGVLRSAPKEVDGPPKPRTIFCKTPSRAYTLYVLPRNTLFTQLTGITESALYVYACFYGERLILAPDAESLATYVRCLDKKEILNDTPGYEEAVVNLSPSYNFMMVADLGETFSQPENYVRLIPAFFFRNQEFFRHFILSAQFTCTDGVVYPNVVLIYKGDSDDVS